MKDLFSQFKILLSFWNILKSKDFPWENQIVRDLEKKLSDYLEIPHVLGVASGTDALILALKACDVKPGDEVIVPAISFVSTAGAVAWIGAKPVFIDIESASFNIDPQKVESAVTPKTKAIIAVHLNGRMADMEAIRQLADSKALMVVEDAAHAFGSKYKGGSIGYYGDLACLSFNPTKVFGGCGDGGAIITKNAELARKISLFRTYGSPRYQEFGINHPIIGTASHLSPFQAAILDTKLRSVQRVTEKTRQNYFLYSELLKRVGDLVLPSNPSEYFINGYRFPILSKKRDELRLLLKKQGFDARIQYNVPLPYFEAFQYLGHKKGDFPNAEKLANEVLCLPTNYRLAEEEVKEVIRIIKKCFAPAN
ncbi:MAG: hypothetical protein A3H69_02335 [Candidatus Sungbacteria bacterium RIFCSPLOWO2_02_FULL_47_9]|uniref:Aminotransferase DegT n=1 Tax=Candidatus Sungbacteria bacterium RIFCSPHIGHO2_01_FULL_47_32 TaxID=1802264 RepID=A0A1G2K6A6_9BACT|nr:MAG: hypothetical protein UX72_C0002G0024 [Parcubacteria group bacterium GW2011_GWA2_47_10]OGZ94979.1 MAG: hypothetical protein A2633_05955 [Candidatus Sungbacteria bacterium RIFCSPHIGHO2_01_FULL_47_32]OGZ99406.1 MAG: hypothetical protein A3D57_00925 [Candidatus Sungbacteria bacterium RIFCSPHIGHO2_02_FULL_46_12]OHA05643.1 MAG: hypothetical protein A3A28_04335 [Candidatus Sungbacteria bacterium RIFCSPLOWO2_01_FULL_47_32]OHA11532.1 MAG: hypothetical protein A3H69_02335 [Candidatus Sungbacteria